VESSKHHFISWDNRYPLNVKNFVDFVLFFPGKKFPIISIYFRPRNIFWGFFCIILLKKFRRLVTISIVLFCELVVSFSSGFMTSFKWFGSGSCVASICCHSAGAWLNCTVSAWQNYTASAWLNCTASAWLSCNASEWLALLVLG
jgi:hypothetical protein